jgi:hypothetical protein
MPVVMKSLFADVREALVGLDGKSLTASEPTPVATKAVQRPFNIVEPIVRDLKLEHMLSLSGTAEAGDFRYTITDTGHSRARAYSAECTYFGAAPVPFRDYLEAMAAQSITKQTVNVEELHEAFTDLIINKKMLDTLGPAINSDRGMFL